MDTSDNSETSNIAPRAANDNSTPALTVLRPVPRRRWLSLLAIPLLAGAASTSVALAHGFGDGGGPGHGDHGAFMQRRLDHLLTAAGASDAQKAQVKAIWEQLRPQLKPLRQQHADLRKQIATAMTAATIDTARIEQLRKQSVQAMDQLSVLMTRGMVQSAQVLTPEQRKLVLQQIEEHRRHHGGPQGEAGGFGGDGAP